MFVALLTDFGTSDGFVGAMKGVIQGINPDVTVIDISHEVEPFNILEGALILRAHYSYMPEGTVFVAVVDPGVGSERKPIAMRLGRYFFVGPYNGIFDLVIRDFKGPPSAVILENKRFQLPRLNNTFHGRDIFAPAAAYITRGVPLDEFGRSFTYRPILEFPQPQIGKRKVRGQIIYFDRFGNAVTNIPCGNYSHGEFRGERLEVVTHFLGGKEDRLSLVCGSFGFMEIFVFMGSAREKFNLSLGEEVVLWKG